MSSRLEALRELTDSLNRKAKRAGRDDPVAFIASERPDLLDHGILATGNPAVDEALGGGFRKGIFAMIWGKQGVGKSRLALDCVAYNQRQNPDFMAMWVHLEDCAFPVQAAIESGVDLERFIVLAIQASGEKVFDLLLSYLWDTELSQPKNVVDLIVIDSVAALLPQAEVKSIESKGFEGDTIGRQAAMMSKAFRKIAGSGALGKAILLMINQVRVGIKATYTYDEMPGGRAVGHFAKTIIRLDSVNSDLLKRGEEVYGHTINGKVVKQNIGPGKPQAAFSYDVHYGIGVDPIGPLLDAAVRRGVITKPNQSAYILPNNTKIVGRENLENRLRDDSELRELVSTLLADSTLHPLVKDTLHE